MSGKGKEEGRVLGTRMSNRGFDAMRGEIEEEEERTQYPDYSYAAGEPETPMSLEIRGCLGINIKDPHP
jgi:hypothetical protein